MSLFSKIAWPVGYVYLIVKQIIYLSYTLKYQSKSQLILYQTKKITIFYKVKHLKKERI